MIKIKNVYIIYSVAIKKNKKQLQEQQDMYTYILTITITKQCRGTLVSFANNTFWKFWYFIGASVRIQGPIPSPRANQTAFLTLSTQYQFLMIHNNKDGSAIGFKLVFLPLLLLMFRPLKLYELIMAHTGSWCSVLCILKTKENI